MKLAEDIKYQIIQNKIKYAIVLAALFLGLIGGTFYSLNNGFSINCAENFISIYKYQNYSTSRVFICSLFSYFRIIILVWLSGGFFFLIPLGFIQIAAKGFEIGCTTVYMIANFGLWGAVFAFSSMFLQNIIFIPLLLAYAVHRLNFAIEYRKTPSVTFKQKNKSNQYKFLLFVLFVAILCVCIETYIVPGILKPICTKIM